MIEVRNGLRVSAAVVVVGVVWEQVLAQRLPQQARRGTHGSLHLVEHNTLEYQVAGRVIGCLELDAVSLLHEIELMQSRKEYGVQIDVE